MITSHEISLAQHCIRHAVSSGASAARVSLNKTVTDSYTILNGELDKVSHSADRSIYIYLFVDGRYGTFSTNRLEQGEVEEFILKGEDKCYAENALNEIFASLDVRAFSYEGYYIDEIDNLDDYPIKLSDVSTFVQNDGTIIIPVDAMNVKEYLKERHVDSQRIPDDSNPYLLILDLKG